MMETVSPQYFIFSTKGITIFYSHVQLASVQKDF